MVSSSHRLQYKF